MKGLEALEKVIKTYFIHNMDKELDIIEKELKALEIIKKHISINGYRIFSDGYEWELPQEEYDLLKEVLS